MKDEKWETITAILGFLLIILGTWANNASTGIMGFTLIYITIKTIEWEDNEK